MADTMALCEPYWDQHVPWPKSRALQSRLLVASVALVCFINSYDGDFVFDDSEAIINNKVLSEHWTKQTIQFQAQFRDVASSEQ